MAIRLTTVTFDASELTAVAAFWSALLDRPALADRGGLLLAGDATQIGLRFVPAAPRGPGPNTLHLHLTSAGDAEQQATVDRALGLGGRHLDVGQLPSEGHIVLADPDGNEFCVIEAGNPFLAGCGFLGEVTCDGGREVGLFWGDTLGWPLVWDRGAQTAIQSPRGGTKVSFDDWPAEASASSAVSSAAADTRGRPRFELEADDPAAEARRLTDLGATPLGRGDNSRASDATIEPGSIAMTDPGGNEFSIRQG